MKTKVNHRGIVHAIVLIIMFSVVSFGCKKSSDNSTPAATQGANEVWIQNMAFGPSTITVAAGTTIKWTNKDGAVHTVTSDSGSELASGDMGNGATFSHQFTAAGTFPYHCSKHSGMTAKVIVN